MISLFFIYLISLCLFNHIYSYTVTNSFCSNQNIQQSPINIVQTQTQYYEEKYFRLLSNRYVDLGQNNTWTYDANTRAIGVSPNSTQIDFGSIIFIKDWGFVNLILQRVNFRVKSSNLIDGQQFDAEMELIHTVDGNYYSPGKRVDLGTNYVIISVPFKVTENDDPQATTLFQWMNLQGFQNGTSVNMTRPIKLFSIVQHQPAYMYEGTLPYGDCLPAWYIQFTQYQLIKRNDLNLLTSATASRTTVDPSNTRNVQPLIGVVYRNWDDRSKLTPNLNLLAFQNSKTLKFNFSLIFLIITMFLI